MHPEKDTAEAFLLRRAAKTGVPITGSFELTPLCNLNCKMCYVRMNRTEQEKISRLQTAEEWTALAEKLRDAGTLFLLLTAYAVRGLDINASYTIYDLINRQKERGVAVIYVGEDLDVLLELADRILVLCGGKVSGIVPGRGATKRDVGMMMTQLGGNEAHA